MNKTEIEYYIPRLNHARLDRYIMIFLLCMITVNTGFYTVIEDMVFLIGLIYIAFFIIDILGYFLRYYDYVKRKKMDKGKEEGT